MDSKELLKKDYVFFQENFEAITKEHIGEFVVIQDEKVIGYFLSVPQAVEFMKKKGKEIGTFIVQKCALNFTDNMVIFRSRVTI